MKIAYFDCFSGISGDMVLGALVDAGLCLETLIEELDKLEVPGLTLTQERTVRQAIAGTHVKVHLGGSPVDAENEHHFAPIAPSEQPSGALLRPPQAAYNQHDYPTRQPARRRRHCQGASGSPLLPFAAKSCGGVEFA